MLATQLSSLPFVPLNPKFPAERLEKIIKITNLRIIVVCEEALNHLSQLRGVISSDFVKSWHN